MSSLRRLLVFAALAASCRAPERKEHVPSVSVDTPARPEQVQSAPQVESDVRERSEVFPPPPEPAPQLDERPHGAVLRAWSVRTRDYASTFLAANQRPSHARLLPGLCFEADDEDRSRWSEAWLVRIDAQLRAPQDGDYELRDSGNARAHVFVDGIALDDEGRVTLRSGWHDVSVQFLATDPATSACLLWREPGAAELAPIPADALHCEADLTLGPPGVRATVELGPAEELEVAQGKRSIARAVVAKIDEDFACEPARAAGGAWFAATKSGRVLRWNPAEPRTTSVFAAGLAESPRAVACSAERVAVAQAGELTELVDADGDGRADEYRALARIGERLRAARMEASGLAAWSDGWVLSCTPADATARGGALLFVPARGEARLVEAGLDRPAAIRAAGEHLVVVDEDPASAASRFVVLDAQATTRGWIAWPWSERAGAPLSNLASLDGEWFVPLANGERVLRLSFDLAAESIQGALSTCAPVRRVNALPRSAADATTMLVAEGRTLVALVIEPGEGFAMHARERGLELEYERALADGAGWDASDYELTHAPELAPAPAIRAVEQSADRKRVALDLGQVLEPGQYELVSYALDESGARLEPRRAWFTWLSPGAANTAAPLGSRPSDEQRRAAMVIAGWEVLFPFPERGAWSSPDVPAVEGAPWRVSAGSVWSTSASFGDFVLELEWRVPHGGAGSLEYRGGAHPQAFALLDESGHADQRDALRVSGASFDREPPRALAAFGGGRWNLARIEVQRQRVRHWLDGVLVIETTLPGDAPPRGTLTLRGRGAGFEVRALRIRTAER